MTKYYALSDLAGNEYRSVEVIPTKEQIDRWLASKDVSRSEYDPKAGKWVQWESDGSVSWLPTSKLIPASNQED